MRLTTKGRFAVAAMVDLATRGGKAPVTLGAISERQGISLSYLEQLFGKLRRNEIVASVRGPGGGYCLARPSSKITIAEIVTAVDEPLDATGCDNKGDCHNGRPCSTHDLWVGLNETIYAYLAEITLKQIVDGQASGDQATSPIKVSKATSKVSA
ncbi:MAG: Rrf2 family transcriptional regulator [Gallionella sp.]